MDAGIVALASFIDLWATLPAPAPGGAAKPRASNDWRCPYCHQDVADGTPRVRCKVCGTKHHQACWEEHHGCSVFGCGSLRHRSPEAAPEERLTAASADPAG
jgi:hypothetical protein